MASAKDGADYEKPAVFDAAYPWALVACAALLALGGLLSWLLIPHTLEA